MTENAAAEAGVATEKAGAGAGHGEVIVTVHAVVGPAADAGGREKRGRRRRHSTKRRPRSI